MQDKIAELEEQLEEKERQLQDTITEIDANSQQQLADLKKFYDGEKQRFEQRLHDVREQGNRRLTETETDYKNQILFQQEEAEEIQNNLNDDITVLTEQLHQTRTTMEGQIALLSQQVEAYEKQLVEKTEALERQTESHQLKLDQQYEQQNAERKELTDKLESSSTKIANLEREKITLDNQIESLRGTIAQREKSLVEQREESEMEKMET